MLLKLPVKRCLFKAPAESASTAAATASKKKCFSIALRHTLVVLEMH